MPKADDSSYQVNLGFNFPFFNQVFQTCYISINGFISFGVDISYPYFTQPPTDKNIIAAFVYDFYTVRSGNITYRSISDSATLNLIGNEVTTLLGLSSNFVPSNAFVITYDSVTAWSPSIDGNVTFQILISTDGIYSFLTINYGDLFLTTATEPFYQYVNNTDYIGKKNFPISSSQSNVNQSGKYIYQLYSNKIIHKFNNKLLLLNSKC